MFRYVLGIAIAASLCGACVSKVEKKPVSTALGAHNQSVYNDLIAPANQPWVVQEGSQATTLSLAHNSGTEIRTVTIPLQGDDHQKRLGKYSVGTSLWLKPRTPDLYDPFAGTPAAQLDASTTP